MSRYLSRLLAGHSGYSGREQAHPTIRSSSPIAEQDQRIGLSGFTGFSLEDSANNSNGLDNLEEDGAAPTAPSISTARTPAPLGAQIPFGMSPVIQRKESNTTAMSSPPSVTAFPNRSQRSDMPKKNAAGAGSTLAAIDSSVRKFTAPSAAEVTQDDVPRRPGVRDIYASPVARAIPAPIPTLSSRERNADDGSGQDPESLVPPRTTTATPHEIAPQPETTRLLPPEPGPVNHAEPAFAPVMRGPVPEQAAPRVVIDRLNVEVIQAPAANANKPAAERRPISAAAASVIGPLSGMQYSNRRLSLRHR